MLSDGYLRFVFDAVYAYDLIHIRTVGLTDPPEGLMPLHTVIDALLPTCFIL